MKQTAEIWIEDKCTIIEYTSFTSEIKEQAYFFMNNNYNVAIVPYGFLIIFINK